MITQEMNDLLTGVGANTRAGNLLRRYWVPVAGSSEIRSPGVKHIRVLGENLVLFRNQTGGLGLITERCPHRGCSLLYGIPEADALRCPYHGWLFDGSGECLEQPAEPPASKFKERIRTQAYRVQEMGGLVFAYMGPDPAPVLPPFDLFVVEQAIRTIGRTVLPCNWFQIMENSLDPTHVEYLHGRFGDYSLERAGEPPTVGVAKHHLKVGFDEFEYGIIKRRIVEGMTEEDDEWTVGHPIIFPYMLRVGRGCWSQFQIRVPIDDESTLIWWYSVIEGSGAVTFDQAMEDVPVHEVPYLDESGKFLVTTFEGQDMMAWVSQGRIADRTTENIATADKGVAMLRRVLLREIEAVEKGDDPLGTLRRSPDDAWITIPQSREGFFQNADSATLDILRQPGIKTSPIVDRLVSAYVGATQEMFASGAAARAAH
jgi:5,5'-dehydrodivanillate O-demethylase oxygenase subunit